MKLRKLLVRIGVVGATAAAVVVVPTGAGAATTVPEYIGWSGATMVTLLDGTVRSDMTAATSLDTLDTGVTNTNSTVRADVPNLLSVGAIESKTASVAVPGGGSTVAQAQTARLSLLGGLITADAVKTTATATRIGATKVSASANTTFVNIHIAGVNLPINIPQNFGINLPGIALIQLNAFQTGQTDDGVIVANGAALYVRLLKGIGNNPAGTEIYLNPTHASIINHVSGPGTVGGFGFSTQVVAKIGSIIGINSDPTAFEMMPPGGTQGKPLTNATVAVNIPGILQVGVLQSTVNGLVKDDGSEDALATNKTGGINLLNGLITADALSVSARVTKDASGKVSYDRSFNLVNLSIAGQKIPISVAPNTVIGIQNLFKVTVYGTAATPNAIAVIGIQIEVLNPYEGLKVGSVINIAGAYAAVG